MTGGALNHATVWVVIYHGVQMMSAGPAPLMATEDVVLFFDDVCGKFGGALDVPPDGS